MEPKISNTHDLAYKGALRNIAQDVAHLTKVATSYGGDENVNQKLDFEAFLFEQMIASQLSFLMFNENLGNVLIQKRIVNPQEYEVLRSNLVHDPAQKAPKNYQDFYGKRFRELLHQFVKCDYDLLLDYAIESANREGVIDAEEIQLLQQDKTTIERISKTLLSRCAVNEFHANMAFVEQWNPLPEPLQCSLKKAFNEKTLLTIPEENIPLFLKNYIDSLFDYRLKQPKWTPNKGDFQNNQIISAWKEQVLSRKKAMEPLKE